MRVPANHFLLLVAGVVLACSETPSRPVAMATFDAPSLTAPGPPLSDVFMKTHSGTCLAVAAVGQNAMAQTLTLRSASDLLLYFTFEWGSLNLDEEGLLSPKLDDTFSQFEWSFAGNAFSRTSGTVMWSFPDVPAGTHTVAANARLEGGDLSAELNECALTVFVIP